MRNILKQGRSNGHSPATRILYHHRTQGRGVEAAHILGTVRAWEKRGIHVDILSPPGVSVGQPVVERTRKDVLSRLFKFLSGYVPEVAFESMEILYNFWGSRRLDEMLSKHSYDFVFERYALLSWAGLRQAKKHSIPFFLEVNYTSFTPLYRKRSRLFKALAHRIDRFLFDAATGLVVVSSQLKEHLIELGVNKDRILVLPNAADPDDFDPMLSGEKLRFQLGLEGKKIVGFVGFFYPWHSVELLIDTVCHLRTKIADVTFVLIGDGPTRKELQDRVHREGLDGHVLFLGVVDHRLLPQYIAMFDVAVLPHSNSYGSPMKIFEYMAMGKPVVAPDLGPLRDGISNGQEGILFEPKNSLALERALCTLLSDSALRRDMSVAARRKVELTHNWDKNADSVLALVQGSCS